MTFSFKEKLQEATNKYKDVNQYITDLEKDLLTHTKNNLNKYFPGNTFNIYRSYGFHPDESNLNYISDLHILIEDVNGFIYLNNGKCYKTQYVEDNSSFSGYTAQIHYKDNPAVDLFELKNCVSQWSFPVKIRMDDPLTVSNLYKNEY